MTENISLPKPKDIDISVIVASVEAERSIGNCLASILASTRGLNVEVIVADGSRDGSAAVVRAEFPEAKLIVLSPGTLAPNLWAEGLARSRGHAVAFTTGHHLVSEGWIAELCAALEAGAAAAGGPITLAPSGTLLDAAVYFLRYSAFMPGKAADPHEAAEIAGDNSMYRREVIERNASALRDGLWEVELHHLLRAGGERLVMIPRATALFGRSFPPGIISRHRFEHGRHFGRWRASQPGESRLRIILPAPLVPFVLLVRAARRVKNADGNLALLIRCSPIFLWLAACWAFGEAVGATETVAAEDANRR
jgi:glycosyltransferase involved in cell wall biosynthesis